MKHLIGKAVLKAVAFSGGDLQIRKLSANAVKSIQTFQTEKPDDQLGLMVFVIRQAVPTAVEMTDEEILDFAVEDLGALSNEILEYSGMGNVKATKDSTPVES